MTFRAKGSRIWPARVSRDRGQFATLQGRELLLCPRSRGDFLTAGVTMSDVPKRQFWSNAEPKRLSDPWRLTKVTGDHTMTAVCEVWAAEMGWDLRLQIYGRGLQMSSLCRSGREMVDRADEWKAAMLEKGWS